MNRKAFHAACVVIAGAFLTSCAAVTDQAPPQNASIVKAAPARPSSSACPKVAFHNFDPARQAAAEQALGDACRIIQSEDFRQAVLAKSDWLASCGSWHPWGKISISPADVNAAYPSGIIDFHLEMGDAPDIAVTRLWEAKVIVEPQRFDGWLSGDREAKSELVATLAHEMTHLIPKPGTTGSNLFRDANNNWLWCSHTRLTSYRIGKITADLWLREQAPA